MKLLNISMIDYLIPFQLYYIHLVKREYVHLLKHFTHRHQIVHGVALGKMIDASSFFSIYLSERRK